MICASCGPIWKKNEHQLYRISLRRKTMILNSKSVNFYCHHNQSLLMQNTPLKMAAFKSVGFFLPHNLSGLSLKYTKAYFVNLSLTGNWPATVTTNSFSLYFRSKWTHGVPISCRRRRTFMNPLKPNPKRLAFLFVQTLLPVWENETASS